MPIGVIKQRPTWGTTISPGSRRDARNTPGPIAVSRKSARTLKQEEALIQLRVTELLKRAREEKEGNK